MRNMTVILFSYCTCESNDDATIVEYLNKKTDKYCCHQIQDELLEVMAKTINRKNDPRSKIFFANGR